MNIADFAKMYMEEKHKGQYRLDGKPYSTHPIAVAELVKHYKKSSNINRLIAAAYLHDILEDTDTTYYDLVDSFGYDIASIVLELTSIKEMSRELGKHKYLAFKLKHMTNWALVLKLCDRLHNIEDMEGFDFSKKKKYIKDTEHIIRYIIDHRNITDTHFRIINDLIIACNEQKENMKKSK